MSLIVVRFKRRRLRNHVLNIAKKRLHGKVQITEHLLPFTRELISLATEIVGSGNVWTNECKVFAKTPNGKIHKIMSQDDILTLLSPDIPTPPQQEHFRPLAPSIDDMTSYPVFS